ncbi:MAG: UPF0182 family protein [Bacillota bacterium]|jgi:uncharacterized membrane protein (UPF0182 family)
MHKWLIPLILVILAALLFSLTEFYTDLLWFRDVSYPGVFWKEVQAKLVVAGFVALAAFVYALVNLLLIRKNLSERLAGPVKAANVSYLSNTAGSSLAAIERMLNSRWVTWGLLLLALVIAISSAAGSGEQWLNFQLYLNRTEFNLTDPLFNQDYSYYVFQLPFIIFFYRLFFGLVVFGFLIALAVYFLAGLLAAHHHGSRGAIMHVSALLALVLGFKAFGYKLEMDMLVYSSRGVASGASYADVHATLPILRILMVLSLAMAFGALINTRIRRFRWTIVLPTALILISVLAGNVYPALVQRFSVEPNELVREAPYIQHNIDATRYGFQLNGIVIRDLPAPARLTQATLAENDLTVNNIRLLDWRLLDQTYLQLQGIRPYYRFADIDIDRYTLDGVLQQVMLGVRELDVGSLQPTARTWINEHLVYTHGYGAVVSPVNRIDAQGQPEFLVADIPPKSNLDELQLTQPQIYFGELTNNYIIVNTSTDEFDYPRGSEANATTVYQGHQGVPLTPFNKLMFSIKYGTAKLFLSDSISAESRIIYRRNIMDRVRTIAPFFNYDFDPYAVVADGKVYWIIDAFTHSSWLPYSEPLGPNGANYIRNSVKVIIDAYNGTVDFYQLDDTDPILQTIAKIYPGLLRPMEQMPASLKAHLRYPESWMKLQAEVLNLYHMEDPTLFYNKEDLWKIAEERYGNGSQQVDPYYMIMSLPGEPEDDEFVLVLPITPAGTPANPKSNMIAWIAARCDPESYGELRLYRFPKDTVVQGPMQIEARIDQDTDISANITLWSSAGSQVMRGNLLVLPIGNSVLYVEPVYLLATNNSLPELKRVIVATGDRLAMRESLGEALAALLRGDTSEGELVEGDYSVAELSLQISQTYEALEQAARGGDWSEYGRRLSQLGQLIERLQDATKAGK